MGNARCTLAWHAFLSKRGRLILTVRELLLAEMDEIATLVSRETGKPVSEALSMEVVPTLDAMHYFAKTTASLLRPQKIDIGQYGLMGRSSRIVYKPLGVVGIISPWNFPWVLCRRDRDGLMAGNAVVVKPSDLRRCWSENRRYLPPRRVPSDLLQIVTGDGSTGRCPG